MPYRIIDSLSDSEIGNETNGKKYGAQPLENGGSDEYAADQSANAAQIAFPRGMHEGLLFIESEISSQDVDEHGNKSHESESARLNEQNNDDLAENAPMSIGIIGDESRDAGRRSGSKEGVDIGSGFPGFGGEGKHEESASDENDGQISQRKILPNG